MYIKKEMATDSTIEPTLYTLLQAKLSKVSQPQKRHTDAQSKSRYNQCLLYAIAHQES